MNALSDFKLRLNNAQTSSSNELIADPAQIDSLIKDYENKILELKNLKVTAEPNIKPKKSRTPATKTSTKKTKTTVQAKAKKK